MIKNAGSSYDLKKHFREPGARLQNSQESADTKWDTDNKRMKALRSPEISQLFLGWGWGSQSVQHFGVQ